MDFGIDREKIKIWQSNTSEILVYLINGCVLVIAILTATSTLAAPADCIVVDKFKWQDINDLDNSILNIDALSVIDSCQRKVDNSNKAADYTRLALANYIAIRQKEASTSYREDKTTPLRKPLNVSLRWAIALGDPKAYRLADFLKKNTVLTNVRCLLPRRTHRDCLDMAEKLEAGNTLIEAKDAVDEDYNNDPARIVEKRIAMERARQREILNIATGKIKQYVGVINWTIEHSCNEGRGTRDPILVRFFEAANGRLTGETWPDKEDKEDVYIIPPRSRRNVSLRCAPTTQVCYGAGYNESLPRSWGLGLNANSGCTSCCYICGKEPDIALTCSN